MARSATDNKALGEREQTRLGLHMCTQFSLQLSLDSDT